MHPVTHRIHQAVATLTGKSSVGPTDVSQFLGLANSQTAKNWETRGPSSEGLVAAAERGISVRWLRHGKGAMFEEKVPIELEGNPDFPSIRLMQFKLSAGVSGFATEPVDDDGEEIIVFRRDWYERNGYRPDSLFAVKVTGDSMEPGLYDGDLVVINTDQTDLKDGRVFAVNYEGEMVIKRLIRDDGQWWLYSDNPNQRNYPPKRCHADTFLIGEIIYKQSAYI